MRVEELFSEREEVTQSLGFLWRAISTVIYLPMS